EREVKLGSAEFQIVAPFAFRIKAEWNHSEQVAAGCGVSEVENVFCGKQTLVGVCWLRRLENLIAHCQRCSHAAGQVRADGRTRASGSVDKDRATTNVAVLRRAALERVIGLRQAPDVMVADRLSISVADANLVVEGLGTVVPHLLQP